MAIDLNGISVFLAVAEARSFRLAAENMGVARPAFSQTIRRLEDRLGVALDATADRDSAPSGLLRLAVSSIAEQFISGPLLARFADAFPSVQIDVTVTDEEFDIVAEGYDAGVRLGEVIDQDMIAVAVSGDQRQGAFAAPSYIERFGKPEHPSELAAHRRIGWRPAPHSAPYRWEFGENGREFDVAVDPQITTNDMWLMIRTAWCRRRHHLRYGRHVQTLCRIGSTGPSPSGLLPTLCRLLSLLSQPAQSRSEASGAHRACEAVAITSPVTSSSSQSLPA
jgi:DNA-binding transcriptional LysR family regulator